MDNKVQRGDQFNVSAETWNSILEAGAAYAQGGNTLSSASRKGKGAPVVVSVLNTGDTAIDRFEVVGFAGLAVTKADNEPEFYNRVVLNSGDPPDEDSEDAWGIAQEAIPANAVGSVMVLGVSQVKIDVGDEGDTRAKPSGDKAHLTSGTDGPANIVWKESGTGEVWAVVLVGSSGKQNSGAVRFRVTTAGPDVFGAIMATPDPEDDDIGTTPISIIGTAGYVDVDDYIWAVPVTNVTDSWIQIPKLPFSANKYEVLQVDESGRYLVGRVRLL